MLLQSGLDENCWADSMECYTYLRNFKISCLMGRHPVKDALGNHFKDCLFHLVPWLSITLLLRRTSQESINLERNIRVKPKLTQETQRSLQKFLEPERSPKVIYTDNSLEFGKACEDLSWNQCTSTPHRSVTDGIAERAVRRAKKRHLCCIVAIGSK